jgi:hypothetical protein
LRQLETYVYFDLLPDSPSHVLKLNLNHIDALNLACYFTTSDKKLKPLNPLFIKRNRIKYLNLQTKQDYEYR